MAKQTYTVEQYRSILETIAGHMNTLSVVLIRAQCGNDERDTLNMVDAAQALATYVGSMADAAIDGSVIGSADAWNYGPNFADLGKEANHG